MDDFDLQYGQEQHPPTTNTTSAAHYPPHLAYFESQQSYHPDAHFQPAMEDEQPDAEVKQSPPEFAPLSAPPPAYRHAYVAHQHRQMYVPEWQLQAQLYHPPLQQQFQPQYVPIGSVPYQMPYQPAHFGYMPIQPQTLQPFAQDQQPVHQQTMHDVAYGQYHEVGPMLNQPISAVHTLAHYTSEHAHSQPAFPDHRTYPASHINQEGSNLSSSPTDTFADRSSPSTTDVDWTFIGNPPSRTSFESYTDLSANFAPTTISNPNLTLQINSDSANLHEETPMSAHSFEDFDHIQFPMEDVSLKSSHDVATYDAKLEQRHNEPEQSHSARRSHHSSSPSESSSASSPKSTSSSIPSSTRTRSPTVGSLGSSSGSSVRAKRTTSGKSAKAISKKSGSVAKADKHAERRVGKRKGPLKPDQRKGASEIRKIKACLRCKFLKKTCDTNDVCAGCKPSHARLWLVPCTRLDIKDLGYFLDGYDFDHARHSLYQIPDGTFMHDKSAKEKPLWVGHGLGYCFPINARAAIFKDETFLVVHWRESFQETTEKFSVSTAPLAVGSGGIDAATLSDYVDAHIGRKFPKFVADHFQGTQFLSEMLITAYDYLQTTQNATVKKALKLVVAYNLTMQLTFLEGEDHDVREGSVKWPASRCDRKQVAPMLINQSVKDALAKLWRELHKEVLADLSSLFTSVYSPEKLKHWPTIFIVSTLLLAVWEELQFDAHYREPDHAIVEKFCNDMESTPVGVIAGLFSAISTKLPALTEWDTNEHKHVLNNDDAACTALTQVRDHVHKHGKNLDMKLSTFSH